MEQIEAIAEKLRSMPPIDKSKQERTMQETIKILTKEIHLLQKRGYTLDHIAESLRGEGLDIATPTLKTYLHRTKGKTATKTKGTTTAKTTGETTGETTRRTSEETRTYTPSHYERETTRNTSLDDFDFREDTPNI